MPKLATLTQTLALQPTLVPGLDALADWRIALEAELAALEQFLARPGVSGRTRSGLGATIGSGAGR